MDEKEAVSYIIHNLPPDWRDFKHVLKHVEEEVSLHQLGVGLCFEESQRTLKLNDNPKGETRTEKGKRSKSTYWFCGVPGHIKKACREKTVRVRAGSSGSKRLGKTSRIQRRR